MNLSKTFSTQIHPQNPKTPKPREKEGFKRNYIELTNQSETYYVLAYFDSCWYDSYGPKSRSRCSLLGSILFTLKIV